MQLHLYVTISIENPHSHVCVCVCVCVCVFSILCGIVLYIAVSQNSTNVIARVIFHVPSKVEVNFALCHEGIWVSGGVPAHILSLALDGNEWLA